MKNTYLVLAVKVRCKFLVLLLALLSTLAQFSCEEEDEIDYTKPGQYGESDIGIRYARILESINDKIPNPIPCDSTIKVKGIATEEILPETCNIYDYSFLYEEALHYATERVRKLNCPQHQNSTCQELYYYVVSQKVFCQDTRATAEVEVAVACHSENNEQASGLQIKSSNDVSNEEFDEEMEDAPVGSNAEVITSEVKSDVMIAEVCPTSWRLMVTVKDEVENCEKVLSYEPIVQKAKAMAVKVAERVVCQVGCSKDDFITIQGMSWLCEEEEENSKAIAVILFTVGCK